MKKEIMTMLSKYWLYLFLAGVFIGAWVAYKQKVG